VSGRPQINGGAVMKRRPPASRQASCGTRGGKSGIRNRVGRNSCHTCLADGRRSSFHDRARLFCGRPDTSLSPPLLILAALDIFLAAPPRINRSKVVGIVAYASWRSINPYLTFMFCSCSSMEFTRDASNRRKTRHGLRRASCIRCFVRALGGGGCCVADDFGSSGGELGTYPGADTASLDDLLARLIR